ncbi:MAG: hypothetical protein MUC38_09850 [Cyclobacteriaceae bacterium]|nr:hypothetical protein [Cyclobacteriaceae bacterium]
MYKNSTIELKNRSEFRWQAKATLWKLCVWPPSSLAVVEVRDEASRRVEWVALNYHNGKTIWSVASGSEGWWRHLSFLTANEVVLRRFESSRNPDRAIYETWSLQEGTPMGAWPEAVVPPTANEVTLPTDYWEGSPEFDTVANYLRETHACTPTGKIEYAVKQDFLVISWYERAREALLQQLVVLHQGREQWRETVMTGGQGFGADSFFMAGDLLFTVKDKKELIVVSFFD